MNAENLNEYHKKAIDTTLQFKTLKAFDTPCNNEKLHYIQEITEIIFFLRTKIEEKDLKWILDDCRYIADQNLIFNLKQHELSKNSL